MKKIAFVTDCWVGPNAGGAEKQLYELACHMGRVGYEVHIISLGGEGQPQDVRLSSLESCPNVSYQLFPVIRVYGWTGFLQGARFRKYLRQKRVDCVMTYHFSSDLWGPVWASLAGVPHILSNRRDNGFWRKKPHILAYKLINRLVKRVVTVSTAVRTMVCDEENYPESRVRVIPNGVNAEPYLSAQSRDSIENIREDDLVAVYVANITPVKDHISLVEAFSKTVREFPNLKLVLIGEDRLKGQLQEKISRLGLEKHVFLLGVRKDVPSLLARADIGLLTSISEGMSNSVLEYMAAGLPVVATNVGGNPDNVVDGETGYLVPVGDVEAIDNALSRLAADGELRSKMGQAGRQRVMRHFSQDAMLKEYENLFQTIFAE